MSRYIFSAVAGVLIAAAASAEVSVAVDATKEIGRVPRELFGTGVRMNMEAGEAVVKLMKETGITVMRYPDAVDNGYRWKWPEGVMTKAGRAGVSELSKLDGALAFAKKVGAKLVFTVRIHEYDGATPEQAAELVRQLGKRGITGACFALGNEPYFKGNKNFFPREKYVAMVKRYVPAIKKADPTAKVGLSIGGMWIEKHSDKGRNSHIIKATADIVDFAEFHCYPGRRQRNTDAFDGLKVAAGAQQIELEIKDLKEVIRRNAPARAGKLEIHIWEWHGPHTPLGDMHRLATALHGADALGVMARHGVKLACQYNMQEHWCGLVPGFRKAFPQDRWGSEKWNGVTVRPIAYSMRLWSKHMGPRLIDCRASGAGTYTSKDWHTFANFHGEVPYVAAWATLSEGGDTLGLMLINKHPTSDLDAKVRLTGFTPKPSATRRAITGPGYGAHNDDDSKPLPYRSKTPAPPIRVKLSESEFTKAGARFRIRLPKHSVTHLELKKR